MPAIATRNLFHDKHKLLLSLTGIIFSVILIALQSGLLLNAIHNASGLIDNAGADVWVMQKETRNVDQCEVMPDRRYYQAVTTPGVAWAERLIVNFCLWKLPGGQQSSVEVVGVEPHSRLNLPWAMASGHRQQLFQTDGIIIDERERRRFGGENRLLQVGDTLEISSVKAEVVGFSHGVGTFTMAPYVFTTFKRAQNYARMQQDQTKFVVLKADVGVSPEELRDRLRAKLSDTDVYTARQFAVRTQFYWLANTGVGLGIIVATLLSLIVGIVIVGQTMYSATIERLKEYGTLKALGMSNLTLGGIIVRQALITGIIGYSVGMFVAYQVGRKMPEFNVPVEVPPSIMVTMFFVTVGMCVIASITSIVRVFRIEPAIVFRT